MMHDDIYEQAEEFNQISAFRHPIKWLKMLAPFKKNWIDQLNLTDPAEYFKIKMLKQEFERELISIFILGAVLIIGWLFYVN